MLACAFVTAGLANTSHAQLSVEEARGKAIYFGERGSALERAAARIADMDVDLSAQSFPCASCHGEKGGGNSERGVVPSNLSRDVLTRPYDVAGQSGRTRPAYTREKFARAVRTGVDSGGSSLDQAMPRFKLTERDTADLWAFLARLADMQAPGIDDNTIRILLTTSTQERSPGEAKAQRKIIEALFADLNAAGGVHGRQLELVTARMDDPAPVDVFAALFPPGQPNQDLPIVGVHGDNNIAPQAFRLAPGISEQEAGLRLFAIREWQAVRLADPCRKERGKIALLSDPSCASLAGTYDKLLVPQAVLARVDNETRRRFPAETRVALPGSLDRISSQAQSSFAKTRAHVPANSANPIAQAEAWSAAVVMIEGFMRAGRGVTRASLTTSLEGLKNFDGGMNAPLSFGPNDRIGTVGVNIVAFDPKSNTLQAQGSWIDPE